MAVGGGISFRRHRGLFWTNWQHRPTHQYVERASFDECLYFRPRVLSADVEHRQWLYRRHAAVRCHFQCNAARRGPRGVGVQSFTAGNFHIFQGRKFINWQHSFIVVTFHWRNRALSPSKNSNIKIGLQCSVTSKLRGPGRIITGTVLMFSSVLRAKFYSSRHDSNPNMDTV